jgi:hypothetical protein
MPRRKHSSRRSKPLSKRKASASPKPHRAAPDYAWIRTLATPYLRGYRALAETHGSLRGYRFVARGKPGVRASRGFFVGYLGTSENYEFLQPAPPECLVFAFLEPVKSAPYRRLVTAEGSLLRRTSVYIGWLTHRRPRFKFFDDRSVVLVRHFSMKAWPAEKHRHFSRNFFIETLAWLVRSGLVAKLASVASSGRVARSSRKQKI